MMQLAIFADTSAALDNGERHKKNRSAVKSKAADIYEF
jgi:hypothetical protein